MQRRQTWFSLRRRPCFECDDARFTFLYPWVQLLCEYPVESTFLDCSDAFITGEEFQTVCPYCKDETLDYRPI